MAGFADDSGARDVVYADNVDFSGSLNPQAQILSNGQLLIGSSVAPNIRPGVITSPLGTLSIGYSSPNITLDLVGGAKAIEHLTGNTGGQLNPDGSNNFNLLGNNTSLNGFASWITGSGSTLTHNSFSPAKWYVNSTAGVGTHTTLAGAMSAASAGDTIVLQTSVTENVTITPGVNIAAFASASLNTVSITGTLTMTGAGTSTVSGITLITNSAALLAVTGSAASIVNLINCYLNCSNNTGITYSSSSASSAINIYHCTGDLGTTGIGLFSHSSSGTLTIKYSSFGNSGSSTTASTCSAGILIGVGTTFNFPITTSSTSAITFEYLNSDCSLINTTSLTTGGSGTQLLRFSRFAGGTASALSIGGTCTVDLCEVNSSNTNAITGAGTINYSGITFTGTSNLINTTTQKSFTEVLGARKVINPAGDYTVLTSDYFVGATSSGARSITLPSSPSTGLVVRIKDVTGTANTNNITITPAAGNIDGSATKVISTSYGSVDLIYNGTQWFVV